MFFPSQEAMRSNARSDRLLGAVCAVHTLLSKSTPECAGSTDMYGWPDLKPLLPVSKYASKGCRSRRAWDVHSAGPLVLSG